MNAEVKALKSFVIQQFYVMKKSLEDLKDHENIPNSLVLIQSPEEELKHLWNENLAKTHIIKHILSSTDNHCAPASLKSVVFPPNLQDEKHKSSANKLCDLPETDGKSIN